VVESWQRAGLPIDVNDPLGGFLTTEELRDRAYSYKAYLDMLRDGTDLDLRASRPQVTRSRRRPPRHE
jgi:hypothetical protein